MAKQIQETHSERFESEIPKNWEIARFDDVVYVTDYVANGSFASLKQNVTYLDDPDYAILVRFTDHVKGWNGNYKYVDEHAYKFLSKSSIEPGDVVIANVGDPGKLFIVPNLGVPMTLGPNSVLVRPLDKELLATKYLAYFYQSSWGNDLIGQITTGTAQQKFNKTGLRSTYIPIAPPEQQKRIVAKIEELFSHIDAGIEALKKAKQLLKQYRQSVLKAAVTGELTKEWREARLKDDAQGSANVAGGRMPGATELEPASQLLERILKERRQKWEEQQLEQFKAKGKMPKDDKWKEKYKEPEMIDDSELAELPSEWLWAKNEQLGAIQLGRQRSPKYHNGPNMRPYLRVQNVFENKIDLDDVMEMDFSKSDYEKYALEYNDILLNEGQSPELLGRPAIYRNELPGVCFTNTLIRFQATDGVMPEYALLVYRYCMHSGRFTKAGTITTNIGHLSAGRFSQIEFPLCGTLEQEEIVKVAEDKFIKIERLGKNIDVQIIKAEKNKQSILMFAFSGRLSEVEPVSRWLKVGEDFDG